MAKGTDKSIDSASPKAGRSAGRNQRLTDALVRSLVGGLRTHGHGNRIHYDADVKGFGVRVTAAGAKAFVLNYRIHGRERRLTIGSWPDWSVSAAREEAKRLKRDVALGHDPLADREAERAAPTMADLNAHP